MITDELRDCIRTANRSYEDVRNPYNDREVLHIPEEELTAIADRIDAEHERMYADFTIGMEPMTEANMARDGWVRLPVDADGVPIHVRDELMNGTDLPAKVRGMVLDESGWMVSTRELRGYGVPPATLRHVQPDSWERIIADALTVGWQNGNWNEVASADIHDKLVERCRRLAGEAE